MSGQIVQFPAPHGEDGRPWEAWVDETVVARHFSASTRTVRRWMAQGMPSQLIGGLRRYRLGDCETWHEARGRRAS